MSTARERLAKAMAIVAAKARAQAERRRARQARHKARARDLRKRYVVKKQSLTTIAIAYGVDLTAVWKWLRDAGIERRSRGMPKGSRGPYVAKRRKAIQRARAGERLAWIEQDLGLGAGVVSRWCRKDGVTPKRGRPREPSAVALVDSALAAVNAHGAATTPRDLVLDLHRQGVAAKTIAADLGLNLATVRRWTTAADTERAERIVAAVREGTERAVVAEMFGVSCAYVTLLTARRRAA